MVKRLATTLAGYNELHETSTVTRHNLFTLLRFPFNFGSKTILLYNAVYTVYTI